MHQLLKSLIKGSHSTGDIKKDMYNFLVSNNCPKTASHCLLVGETASTIAHRFGADEEEARTAGFLHDISAVFPNHERIDVAKQLDIEVLPEELEFPMIIHQKISKVMSMEIFKIHNKAILDAVGCHTTLRKGSTILDRVLFVADKISWDQEGVPPYLERLQIQLNISLDHGAFEYINYLWERKESLRVLHPWLADAYHDFKDRLFA
jgi:predicted HD superfamily hydrolase involved in NAD metabolism